MKNKLLIYTTLILLIIVAFIGGYYFANIYEKKLVEPIKQVDEKQIQTIQFKPGEDRFYFKGTIYSIDTTKNPAEIVMLVVWDLNRFIIPPLDTNPKKTVLITEHAFITKGEFRSPEVHEIDITELKRGDNILVRTHECISDLKDTYFAFLVRKIYPPNQ